jgi:hypothetical protein
MFLLIKVTENLFTDLAIHILIQQILKKVALTIIVKVQQNKEGLYYILQAVDKIKQILFKVYKKGIN